MNIKINWMTLLLSVPFMITGFLIVGFTVGWLPAIGVFLLVFGSTIEAIPKKG